MDLFTGPFDRLAAVHDTPKIGGGEPGPHTPARRATSPAVLGRGVGVGTSGPLVRPPSAVLGKTVHLRRCADLNPPRTIPDPVKSSRRWHRVCAAMARLVDA